MAPPRCLVAKMSRCKLKYALPLYVSSTSLTYLAPLKFTDQVAARTQQPDRQWVRNIRTAAGRRSGRQLEAKPSAARIERAPTDTAYGSAVGLPGRGFVPASGPPCGWPYPAKARTPRGTCAVSAVNVAPRRVGNGRVPFAPHRRRLRTAPGPPGRPPGPVLPPRPAVMRRALPPLLRGRRVRRLAHLVPGLRAGRVHDPGDVAPAGQHVTDIPAHQACRLARRGPGHDVVVDGAHHVGVVLDVGQ